MDKWLSQQFQLWLNSPIGQALLRREKIKTEPITANIFGYLALQIGLPQIDYLAKNRTQKKLILSSLTSPSHITPYPFIQTDVPPIPLEEQSVDLVVLAHALELNPDPKALIKEVHRVLIHEGTIVITGFNPWHISMLRKLYRSKKIPSIPYKNCISIHQLKEWFTLYGFEIDPQKLHLNHWSRDGIFYIITARKRSVGMHLIGPAIPKRSHAPIKTAVATHKVNKQ